jgi:uncharacterized repeat protein (TIGR03803 family)
MGGQSVQNLTQVQRGGKDGGGPRSSVIVDDSGNLYGTATYGGANNQGAVFELTNVNGSRKEKVIYSFCHTSHCRDGANPYASLIFDATGDLYGTTESGGDSVSCPAPRAGCGVVFELMPEADGTWAEKVLHRFNSSDGANPYAGLIIDHAGNLYGTTYSGGDLCNSVGCGVVFQLTPNSDGSWQENVIYTFCQIGDCLDGAFPAAPLIFDAAGNLYSTTSEGGEGFGGGGTVFQLARNAKGGWSESLLYSFCSVGGSCYDGRYPYGGVIFDQTGNIYGTTTAGGAHINGAVFQLTPNQSGSWNETVLHSSLTRKNGFDGGTPYDSLIFDQAGNLYGTMEGGGAHGWGVVFKLASNSKGGWDETVLHALEDDPGALPLSGLTFDAMGNLYGTTSGDFSKTTHGSVFEITP